MVNPEVGRDAVATRSTVVVQIHRRQVDPQRAVGVRRDGERCEPVDVRFHDGTVRSLPSRTAADDGGTFSLSDSRVGDRRRVVVAAGGGAVAQRRPVGRRAERTKRCRVPPTRHLRGVILKLADEDRRDAARQDIARFEERTRSQRYVAVDARPVARTSRTRRRRRSTRRRADPLLPIDGRRSDGRLLEEHVDDVVAVDDRRRQNVAEHRIGEGDRSRTRPNVDAVDVTPADDRFAPARPAIVAVLGDGRQRYALGVVAVPFADVRHVSNVHNRQTDCADDSTAPFCRQYARTSTIVKSVQLLIYSVQDSYHTTPVIMVSGTPAEDLGERSDFCMSRSGVRDRANAAAEPIKLQHMPLFYVREQMPSVHVI